MSGSRSPSTRRMIEGCGFRYARDHVIQVAVLALHLFQLDPEPFLFGFVQTHSSATHRQYETWNP